MEKRYQVFVSSTYEDLKEERSEVVHALLELDCIPAGMELFPAADEDQWSLIKKVIDESDYYILIIGGRYGSTTPAGLSYTQMEYEYAQSIGIPIISFLHKSPDDLPVKKSEKTEAGKNALKAFREIAQQKMCKYWTGKEELGSIVSRSLVKLISTKPGVGWIKGNLISSQEAGLEILRLSTELKKLQEAQPQLPFDVADLEQGDDLHEFRLFKGNGKERVNTILKVSWNDLFSKTCTKLLSEAAEEDLIQHIREFLNFRLDKGYPESKEYQLATDDYKEIIIQFKALGLIERSTKKKHITDTKSYWKLTEHGDRMLTSLRAIKRKPAK